MKIHAHSAIDTGKLSVSVQNKLLQEINHTYLRAVKIRRLLHQFPELSTVEFQTAKRIFHHLRSIGLAPHYCLEKTGVWSEIKNGPGKTVVLRADIDALPIQERNSI